LKHDFPLISIGSEAEDSGEAGIMLEAADAFLGDSEK
jgi:hypothetical protein